MNNKKREYETPQMEITSFEVEDIITTSSGEINGGDDDIG